MAELFYELIGGSDSILVILFIPDHCPLYIHIYVFRILIVEEITVYFDSVKENLPNLPQHEHHQNARR